MNNKDEKYFERVLTLALDLAKSMVKCSAEINRVEETVLRICYAYGADSTQVFSVVSMIIATVKDEEGNTKTQMRRIHSYGTNFSKLEKLNALSREICKTVPDIDAAMEKLHEIDKEKTGFNIGHLFAYMLTASSFTIFFGGNFKDAAASALISLVVYFFSTYIQTSGTSKLFVTFFLSIICGALALLSVRIGFADNPNEIMIGVIMLIIPGLMLINSLREMLCGDLVSGLLRFLEAVILALAIACGFAVPIFIGGKLF